MTAHRLHLQQQLGLVRVTVEGADEQTVRAFAHALSECHQITGPSPIRPIPGEAGVHTWMYARPQDPTETTPVEEDGDPLW